MVQKEHFEMLPVRPMRIDDIPLRTYGRELRPQPIDLPDYDVRHETR